MSTVAELLRQRLTPLEPEFIDITDESALHTGHAGAVGAGSHIQLLVVSQHFNGISRIARHRLVYRALDDLIPARIHALALKAMTPDEI